MCFDLCLVWRNENSLSLKIFFRMQATRIRRIDGKIMPFFNRILSQQHSRCALGMEDELNCPSLNLLELIFQQFHEQLFLCACVHSDTFAAEPLLQEAREIIQEADEPSGGNSCQRFKLDC